MLVLVVDDDRAVREALERALQLHGYEVALASDGDTALSAVDLRTPDAVVLDVMMPGLDGFEVTRRLRADPETRSMPIIILTARAGAPPSSSTRSGGHRDARPSSRGRG